MNTMLTVRSLSVAATDNADIEAIAVGASVAVGVGGTVVGVAISIGVAIAKNTVSNSVIAELKDGALGADQMVVACNGDLCSAEFRGSKLPHLAD